MRWGNMEKQQEMSSKQAFKEHLLKTDCYKHWG